MVLSTKIKRIILCVGTLSLASIIVHLCIAKSWTTDLVQFKSLSGLPEDFASVFGRQGVKSKKLWGSVKALEALQPYPNPRSNYSVPNEQNNGFIYAKVSGGFAKIRSSISDLVAVSKLLNATLVIPEFQETIRSKGVSYKFKSFSYIYNEDQFIEYLKNDVIIAKSLPVNLKEARKRNEFPTFRPKYSASTRFYIEEILPKLKKAKVIGLIINDGGCLQSILPPSMSEFQRLRCRVAYHALQFRPEIQLLGRLIVERLRARGQPFLVFHPGLVRDTLAYNGCAELFQDVHTELIQYRRAQMIKRGVLLEELSADSRLRRDNGSCPLMPEEGNRIGSQSPRAVLVRRSCDTIQKIGLDMIYPVDKVAILLRAIGYSSKTIIYLAGSETFGGQRVLIPLRAMFPNLVDRTSLCSPKELSHLFGPESSLPPYTFQPPRTKSEEELKEEWKRAGPRPRPLPPPPDRPIYQHEKEGWYGWITETTTEPDPSPLDLRMQAHRLLWDALDFIVSVEADAFFPGFHNDGSGLPDFSSLVMGERVYMSASSRTYRPDRKYIAQLFNITRENLYHPRRNWTTLVQEHLNKSLSEEGLIMQSLASKPASFLSHPLPECSCRMASSKVPTRVKGKDGRILYGDEEECPKWMRRGGEAVSLTLKGDEKVQQEDNEMADYENAELSEESQFVDSGGKTDVSQIWDQDEEMDPND